MDLSIGDEIPWEGREMLSRIMHVLLDFSESVMTIDSVVYGRLTKELH